MNSDGSRSGHSNQVGRRSRPGEPTPVQPPMPRPRTGPDPWPDGAIVAEPEAMRPFGNFRDDHGTGFDRERPRPY